MEYHAKHRFHSGFDEERNDSSSDSYGHHSLNIVQTVESSLILLLNGLLFLLIITRPKLRRKKSHQFILNLLLINVALSVSCMLSDLYTWVFDYVIINGLLLTMFVNLMLTTADRFLCMKYASRYCQLTGNNVIIILCCSWIPTLVFVPIVKLIGITPDGLKLMHIVIIMISCLVLGISNFKVYYMAKNHDRFVKHNSNQRRRFKGGKKKFLKASYICFAVVFSFILFWMPYCFHDILELADINIIAKKHYSFHTIVEHLALLNSVSDPIIFTFLSIPTRKEIRLLWESINCRWGHKKDIMLTYHL